MRKNRIGKSNRKNEKLREVVGKLKIICSRFLFNLLFDLGKIF